MKANRWSVALQAIALSFLLSFGAVGSAVTGLELNVTGMGRIAVLCLCVSLAVGLLSRIRFGGWLVSALILGAAVGIWRIDAWQNQMVDMLCRITRYYSNAYGWVMVRSPLQGDGLMDWPVGCFAVWIAAVNCWNLSKGMRNHTGIITAVLPLIASVVVIDTVPGSVYLYIWLLGLVLTLLSGGLRRKNPRWGMYIVRTAAVPTALALGLLFWAVPREGYDKHPDELQQTIVNWFQKLPDLWGRITEDIAEKVDGTIQLESINLQKTGPRINRVYPVMEVTAPMSGTVYLRGQHYDIYTGTGWQASEGQETFGAPRTSRELGRIDIRTRTLRDVLYLPYYPEEELTLTNGAIDNRDREKESGYTMRGLPSHWRNMVLSATATMELPFFALGRAGNSEDRNLHLPDSTYAWAVEKAADILSGESSATEVADTVAKYVRDSARYDLDTERMPWESTDFAQWFLEESDTGYCVHFATAATVLLRAAGVEARYVEGYMFTTRMGEQTTVTADQAHAWAEYYEPLLDTWIVLEATPPDLGEETVTQPETQAPVPSESEQEPAQSSPPHPETTEAPLDLPVTPQEGQEPSGQADLSRLWDTLAWILALGTAALVLEGQRRLRLQYRKRRFIRGSLRKQALERYRELERLCVLLKQGIPEEATQLAQKAKYSRRGVEQGELDALETMLESVITALKEAPWYRKILYKFIFAAY